jgi:hypothetical protein
VKQTGKKCKPYEKNSGKMIPILKLAIEQLLTAIQTEATPEL